MDAIEKRLYRSARVALLPAATAARLAPVDARSYSAGMMGADPQGLYQPKTSPTVDIAG
jgi:hypothetical protein